ncbi:ABC-type multidrug transport system, ATPase and permease component [Terriglobus roseus DSM 18391]|uniref:ABC-type multidrug transport system, ATPase and permease component n=1 Tax=Terriglobus roseus (strain DSM 18391 / NRRL B-41598 / KBS 63) TaxID=926566 RepID=I3ZI49_TERRK|nr:ABC transporter ATP-binding protein [Terriglobus roseus]AFL88917.1 ABC-type multidrug transport system, ATPase and permease component [Terriglobus roseus DSM 18391]
MPDKQETRRITIKELLRPHRRALMLGLVAIAGESIADVAAPWPLKIVLDNVIAHKESHGWLFKFIKRTAGTEPHQILMFACIAVVAIAIVDAFCSYWEKYTTTSVGQWVTHDLRRTLYAQVQRLSLSYHDTSQTGDLISRVTTDIDSIQSFIVSGLLSILVDIATIVGMIGVLFYLSWQLTLIALAVVPILFAIVYTYTRKVKKASRAVRKQEGKMISVVQEVLGSIRVVKAFSREQYEIDRLEGESLETVEASLKARTLKAKLVPIVNIVTALGTCGVLYFGGRLALDSNMTGGKIYIFIAYIAGMYKPMQDISKIMDSYSKADIGYERIQEIIGNQDEMRDAAGAKNLRITEGRIELDNVSFSYNSDREILHDVTMRVEPCSTVAIVGPTGSGKTTLINLIARFYEPQSGTVRIDGQDVSKVKQKSLREQLSFVLQDTVLFSGSIWENIAYGRPEATHAEIVQAAKDANADEFIDCLPQKYDTVVGERGILLSGGQRQRIAIARAMVRNSPILILDEPTSALDANSEHLVFEALDRLMEGKTAIVIAHRLSTVRNANCIYVLQDGRVVENGTHDELIHAGGLYQELNETQAHADEEKSALLA